VSTTQIICNVIYLVALLYLVYAIWDCNRVGAFSWVGDDNTYTWGFRKGDCGHWDGLTYTPPRWQYLPRAAARWHW
jgi:hypothetical protein